MAGDNEQTHQKSKQDSRTRPPTHRLHEAGHLVASWARGIDAEGPINHPKRSHSLVRKRILREQQRTEPGIDGLARTSLRFS